MEVSGQLHVPAALLRGKRPWYPLDRRLGGPQSRSGRGGEEKNSQLSPGIEPPNPDHSACSQDIRKHKACQSRDSSVGIALGYGLEYRGSRVRFPAGAGNFSLHHRVQNGSGAHSASYPIGNKGSFPGGKATGA
jgi:hypothetical protein